MESEVLYTPEATQWYRGLSDRDADRVDAALEAVVKKGPNLGRPLVDRVHGAQHHKMKELRVSSSNQRALFAFVGQSVAVVLLGGDKTGEWNRWYDRELPTADRRLEQYERRLGGNGQCLTQRTGARSATRGR